MFGILNILNIFNTYDPKVRIGAYVISKALEKSSSPKKVNKLNFGDVIYVDRGAYQHFGIYSGEDKVIHYTKVEGGCLDGVIRETSLKKFLEDAKKCFVCNFDKYGNRTSVSQFNVQSAFPNPYSFPEEIFDRKLYSPEETVRRARNSIGKKGYDLVCNNCEHFAIWCKTGIKESKQVKAILSVILPNNPPAVVY